MDLQLEQILKDAQDRGASDVFFIPGKPLSIKINGQIIEVTKDSLMPPDIRDLLVEIYRLTGNRSIDHVDTVGDDDFSFSLPGVARFRVSAFKQRGTLSAVIRIVAFELPDPVALVPTLDTVTVKVGAWTVTVQEAVCPPSSVITLMTAGPGLTAVTRPDAFTVATAVSLLLHVTFMLVAFVGLTVAVSCSVPPAVRVMVDVLRVTPVTGTVPSPVSPTICGF